MNIVPVLAKITRNVWIGASSAKILGMLNGVFANCAGVVAKMN
jgi:hypothetical protein